MSILKTKKKWVVALMVIPLTFGVVTLFQNCAPGLNQSLATDENGMVSAMPMASNSDSGSSANLSGSAMRNSGTARQPSAAVTENQMGGMIAPPAESRNECSYTWFSGPFSLQTSGGKNGLPLCSSANPYAAHRFQYKQGDVLYGVIAHGELVCVPPAKNCNAAAPPSSHRPIVIHVFKAGAQDKLATEFQVNEPYYAYIRGVDGVNAKDLASCTDIIGETNNCNDATKYIEMPNSFWHYYGLYWSFKEMKVPAEFAGKTVRLYVMNKATGVRSVSTEFKVASGPGIVPPISCGWTGGGFVAGPCSANSKVCNQQSVGSKDTVQCASGPSTSTCVCK